MATEAEAERPPAPAHSPEPEAQPPAEAAWGPTEPAPGEITGEPTAAWPSPDPREEQDPLLSAWESAFLAGADSGSEDAGSDPALGPHEPEASNSKKKDEGGEPSLRELFWGEE
jgi:hypothetical protein